MRPAAIQARTRRRSLTELVEEELVEAAVRLDALTPHAERQAQLAIEVREVARACAPAGRPGAAGSGARTLILGCALTERELPRGLERSYRTLTSLAGSARRRVALVHRASSVRPVTWV